VVVRPGGSSGGGTRHADGENADGGDASSPPEGKVARSIGSLETFRDSSFLRRCEAQSRRIGDSVLALLLQNETPFDQGIAPAHSGIDTEEDRRRVRACVTVLSLRR
jgi:hypothetical protein